MPFLNAGFFDARRVEKAIHRLLRYPNCPNFMFNRLGPPDASRVFYEIQFDQTLTLKFFDWIRPHTNFDLRTQCIALHLLSRFKLYRRAEALASDVTIAADEATGSSVYECLKDTCEEFNSSARVFQVVVRSFSRLKMVNKALNVMNLARRDGFGFGVGSFNAVMDAIVRSRGSMEVALEVYADIGRSGLSPTAASFNILLRGFLGEGKSEKGLAILSAMQKKGFSPNLRTFNVLIEAHCKSGRIKEAYKLLKSMPPRGLEPEKGSYEPVITGLCREGMLKEAGEVLKEMNRRCLSPDEKIHNELLKGYCRDGNFHQALLLYADMARSGFSPAVQYTRIIDGVCQEKNLNRAMELADQSQQSMPLKIDQKDRMLADGLCQGGSQDEAIGFLSGSSPLMGAGNALGHGHCMLGKPEQALRVVEDMAGKGVAPDKVSHGSMILGLCREGEVQRAFEVMREMTRRRVVLDVATYSVLVQGLCEQDRRDDARKVVGEMAMVGLPPDEVTYTVLINACCRRGSVKEAVGVHKEMIGRGIRPDSLTYSVLINGMYKQTPEKERRRLVYRLRDVSHKASRVRLQ